VAVPALVGTAAGAALAGAWLIPQLPPGLAFLGLALLLTASGSLAMGFSVDPKEGEMAERVVIVTGAGDRGQVGYAVAEAFVRSGARVVVTARGEAIRDTAMSLGDDVVGVAADLADPEGAEAVVEAARSRWGRLDALINVAGGLHVMKPVEETTPAEWDREVESNVRTTFLMSRAALPLLREARGAIVNFASPAGLRAVKGMAAYSAGKAGVVALTRSLALEEREHGVRVNAVAPGMVDTVQNRASLDDPGSASFVSRDAIIEAVLFLAGAAGVSGEVLPVTNADLTG
jgi:meso-butanediol dehydrogenase/(S,S)-butanediol dehydrogenase/diacetyl reductase